MNYDLVKSKPVAKFYYQGTHTHPVRRTVLVVETTPDLIRGYEVREGSLTRPYNKALVKAYRKDKIAKIGQCGRRLRKRTPIHQYPCSTLARSTLLEFVKMGA